MKDAFLYIVHFIQKITKNCISKAIKVAFLHIENFIDKMNKNAYEDLQMNKRWVLQIVLFIQNIKNVLSTSNK